MGAIILLRIVHIGLGVFWAGGVLFMNFIVGPAIGAAGPAGFSVLQQMNRRRYFDVVLLSGLLTILAGLDLMRRDSAGFQDAWFHSPFGIGITTGMLAAVIAFLIGLTLIRPALKRMVALGAEMMAATAPQTRTSIAFHLDAARGRLIALGLVASVFLIIAVLAMATARYL